MVQVAEGLSKLSHRFFCVTQWSNCPTSTLLHSDIMTCFQTHNILWHYYITRQQVLIGVTTVFSGVGFAPWLPPPTTNSPWVCCYWELCNVKTQMQQELLQVTTELLLFSSCRYNCCVRMCNQSDATKQAHNLTATINIQGNELISILVYCSL